MNSVHAVPTSITGRIFDIQKFSVHDGPGIRTLVFFKGCPLECAWCSNPEGISHEFQPFWSQDRCVSCAACVDVCPAGLHVLRNSNGQGRHLLDRSVTCQGCRRCVHACPRGALRLVGRDVTVADVMDEVRKDFAFYANSGGGLTIGGGEPTAQPAFAEALLREARREAIHAAMESCAMAKWEVFERLLPHLDLLLVDIKHLDEAAHRRLTGVSNSLVLENVARLLRGATPLIVRLPLIPNVNDGANIAATLAFVRDHDTAGMVERIDILPYHRYGVDKYGHLGLDYGLSDVCQPERQAVVAAAEAVTAFGYPVRIQPTAA